ncbi:Zn-finger in ubiquitin-hydrolase (macronuclear) [Tetrahymena thermophila SB210]|uniref:Zn-finger in ubiquitin-hydrolase n=1 Tax=Tetrahymena thermophila (strain SB210) TaxID=312017 RepID=Q22MQ4_TETTS|nr:Zn-finger in ubiquitin-hydrolase [Tetrahymena thermophila SB210]EAR86307.2 Zn-finger in ubiquitin-hydrolase [Tetrahymena thermophila SB210]|eukprot:XP_976966.2 Zn-finger in ubiquitin-hydrolase [Tetrahymena thermophila SB210]
MINLQAGQAFIDPFTGEEAFAVEPITNCPHALKLDLKKTEETIYQKRQQLFWSQCSNCENVGENWFCLICNNVYCSRYVKGHMAMHNQQNQDHQVAVSFSDLSFWCYECDSYITNQDLSKLRKLFQKAKFNEGDFSQKQNLVSQSDKNHEEISQKAINGNGFFVAGDIKEQKVYQVLILSQFQKDIIVQKGVLKGYQIQNSKSNYAQQIIKNESEEVLGSVIRFGKNLEQVTREKIAYLMNEIEGFPIHTSIKFEKVISGEEQLELAIYCLDD